MYMPRGQLTKPRGAEKRVRAGPLLLLLLLLLLLASRAVSFLPPSHHQSGFAVTCHTKRPSSINCVGWSWGVGYGDYNENFSIVGSSLGYT